MNLDEDSVLKIICTYGLPIAANVERLADIRQSMIRRLGKLFKSLINNK